MRAIAVLIICLAWSGAHATDFAPPTGDGWYSWQVVRAASAAHKEADRGGRLLRIYVRMRDGKTADIRMQTHHCWDGGAPKEYVDLGQVDNSASIAWLKTQVAPRSKITEDALFALAAHDGDEVFDYFDQLISRSTK